MINNTLKTEFIKSINFNPLKRLAEKKQEQLPVDYFQFYNSISSVYSSKIEGENIDFDSFFKHKFLNVPYNPDYTKKSDDLYKAYQFIQENLFNETNVLKVHEILSQHLLPESQRGKIRNNPMFILNENDRIEYVVCEPFQVRNELKQFFEDLEKLVNSQLLPLEVFFYAAQIH